MYKNRIYTKILLISHVWHLKWNLLAPCSQSLLSSLWPGNTIWWHKFWVTIGSDNGLLPEPNVNLSSKEFCDVPLKAISQELLMNLIHNICSKVILLKLLPHFPGANELSTRPGHQPSGPQMVAKVIHPINSYWCLWAVFSWEYDSLEQGCLTIWFDSLGQGCDFISLGYLTPFGADRGRPGVKCLVKDTSNWL